MEIICNFQEGPGLVPQEVQGGGADVPMQRLAGAAVGELMGCGSLAATVRRDR